MRPVIHPVTPTTSRKQQQMTEPTTIHKKPLRFDMRAFMVHGRCKLYHQHQQLSDY